MVSASLHPSDAIICLLSHSPIRLSHQLRAPVPPLAQPVMDGHEATARIRQLIKEGTCRETPIVALSALCSDQEVQRCKDVGMVAHISKVR